MEAAAPASTEKKDERMRMRNLLLRNRRSGEKSRSYFRPCLTLLEDRTAPAALAVEGNPLNATGASGDPGYDRAKDPIVGYTSILSAGAVTIDWGDGSALDRTTGWVGQTVGSNGLYGVHGNHTYAEEGTYPIRVAIGGVGSFTSTATVADPPVQPKGSYTFSGTKGVDTGSVLVATFTDPGGAEAAGSYLSVVSPSGVISQFAPGVSADQGAAVDSEGNLFFADDVANVVRKMTPQGVVTVFATGFRMGGFLAVDRQDNLYCTNGDGTVSRVGPGGGVATTFAWGFPSPTGLVFDASGNLYAANYSTGTISKVGPGGGVATTFATGLHGPLGLAIDPSGNLYVANWDNGTVSKVGPGGGVATTFATGLAYPWGIAFGPGQQAAFLYVTSWDFLSKVAPDGTLSRFATGFNDAHGIAFDKQGNLVVINKFGNYGANINWGDGQSSDSVINFAGTLGSKSDVFSVTGNHVYAQAGSYTVSVAISHDEMPEQVATCTATIVQADTTAPVTTAVSSGQSYAAQHAGWNNTDVTVTLAATDAGGPGLALTEYTLDGGAHWTPYAAPFTLTNEGTYLVGYRSVDTAGSTETTKTLTVKIDKTPPTVSARPTFGPAATGWYNVATGVPVIHFTATDGGSGVAGVPADQTLGEGSSVGTSATIYDVAGNSAVASISGLRVDLTPPTVSERINAPAPTGWYNLATGPAVVTYTATDNVSGVVAPAAVTLGEGVNQAVPGVTVTDAAGNVSAPTSGFHGINVDLHKPAVFAAPLASPGAYGWYNGPVVVRYFAGDNLSGVSAPADEVLYSEGAVSSSPYVCVTDGAGNTSDPANVVTAHIDRTRPTTGLSVVGKGRSGATVRWASGDQTSGVVSTVVTVDGRVASTANAGSLALPPGKHAVSVTATDAAGNVKTDGQNYPQGDLPAQTVGTFDPATATWYLRNGNSPGVPDAGSFVYGAPGWKPVVGDWDGDGSQTVGVVDPTTMTWYLRNANSAGQPDVAPFRFGLPGWVPVAGDWGGSGHSGIGVYDPATGTWYLRAEASPGAPDAGVFQYGGLGWLPVVGDWDGNGTTTVGVVVPNAGAYLQWYLRNSNGAGLPDVGPFLYGLSGWQPVAGDWSGSGHTGVGAVAPDGTWFLHNSANGGPPDATPFSYGAPGWAALSGSWVNNNLVTSLLAAKRDTAAVDAVFAG
jgi:hypothetical protein